MISGRNRAHSQYERYAALHAVVAHDRTGSNRPATRCRAPQATPHDASDSRARAGNASERPQYTSSISGIGQTRRASFRGDMSRQLARLLKTLQAAGLRSGEMSPPNVAITSPRGVSNPSDIRANYDFFDRSDT